MTAHDPFDASPDVALGRLLRDHLSGGADAQFVARVRTAVAADRDTTSWDVLSRWARPGLVAAAAVAFSVGVWLALQQREAATLADAMQPAGAPAQLLAGTATSGPDLILVGLADSR